MYDPAAYMDPCVHLEHLVQNGEMISKEEWTVKGLLPLASLNTVRLPSLAYCIVQRVGAIENISSVGSLHLHKMKKKKKGNVEKGKRERGRRREEWLTYSQWEGAKSSAPQA